MLQLVPRHHSPGGMWGRLAAWIVVLAHAHAADGARVGFDRKLTASAAQLDGGAGGGLSGGASERTRPLHGVFFAVTSYPINVRGRETMRSTWIKEMVELGAQYRFFIGGEGLVERFFEWESTTDDVVRLNFYDHHKNLTRKTEGAAAWAAKNVNNMKFFVKIDEDVLPSPQNFLKMLPTLPTERLYGGTVIVMGAVPGYGKYHLEDEFRWVLDENQRYPNYCVGNMYILSRDAAELLAAHHDDNHEEGFLFPFEDINTALVLKHADPPILPTEIMTPNGEQGTRYLLSHDLFSDLAHNATMLLCENDYVAYHPVTAWEMENAFLHEDRHAFTCQYMDKDHSRYRRHFDHELAYYAIRKWYDPERLQFQTTTEVSLKHQEAMKNGSSDEAQTAVVLTIFGLDEITTANIHKFAAMSRDTNLAVKVLYDADTMGMDETGQLRQLAGANVELIPMKRSEQKAIYPKAAFDTFSGLYGAPAKPAAITWMASDAAKKYQHAWFIEGDVVFTGKWETLIDAHLDDHSDFMSPHFAANAPGYPNEFWQFWGACDLASGASHAHSLISMHRVSRQLAIDIKDYLLSGRGGHHEYVYINLCLMNPGCTAKQIDPENTYYFKFRPPRDKDWLRENWVANRIYHPIKPDSYFGKTN